MIETVFNAVWLALAGGVLLAALRCTPRVRVALLIAVALLFPVISISDDFNPAMNAFDDAAAIAVVVVIAFVLVALSRVHSVTEPQYAVALATPSDPRSPPR